MTQKPKHLNRITTLSEIGRGESSRVISIEGGQAFRSKLHHMGIHGAVMVTVRRNDGAGPLVLEIGGTRLILGRGMAERLWVSRT